MKDKGNLSIIDPGTSHSVKFLLWSYKHLCLYMSIYVTIPDDRFLFYTKSYSDVLYWYTIHHFMIKADLSFIKVSRVRYSYTNAVYMRDATHNNRSNHTLFDSFYGYIQIYFISWYQFTLDFVLQPLVFLTAVSQMAQLSTLCSHRLIQLSITWPVSTLIQLNV